MYLISVILVLNNIFKFSYSGTPANYGPFDLKIKEVESCKGSKSKDCSVSSLRLIDDGKTLISDVSILRDTYPNKGRITSFSNGNQLMRVQIDNPCTHIFLKPLLDVYFNITKNCLIKKGNYKNEVDVAVLFKKYFDGKFLYGNMTFKSQFYNKDCNIICCNMVVELVPK